MNEFKFCPNCNSKKIQTLAGGTKWKCPDCGFNLYNNIAAAVGLILVAENRFLTFSRVKDPQKGKLGLPGGFVNAGETLEEACKRECHEEIGIEPPPFKYLCSSPNDYPYKNIAYKTCDVFFYAEFPGTAQELLDSVKTLDGEAENCIMPSFDEINLDDIAFNSMRIAIKTYMNLKR